MKKPAEKMAHFNENWIPNPQDLSQAIEMIQALRDPRRADHLNALKSLEVNVSNPMFISVILYIFVRGKVYETSGLSVDLRQLSGLIIKNYVFPRLTSLSDEVQGYVKQELLLALRDQVSDIRNTAAILIGKISESFPVKMWMHMLPSIMECMELHCYTTQPYALDGCTQAMKRICEDSSVKLSMDEIMRPLDQLIPKLLDLFHCPDSTIRLRALESYNCLLYLLETPNSTGLKSRETSFDSVGIDNSSNNPSNNNNNGHSSSSSSSSPRSFTTIITNASHPLLLHMNAFIQLLSALSNDSDPQIRKAICQAITIIACLHLSLLEPFFANICNFMLTSLLDSDENVAMESCEFWMALLYTNPEVLRAITPYLKGLIEGLIQRLYLTKEQMEAERIEEEEENSGVKELNLQPIHHRVAGNDERNERKENSELSSKWTLRKQAARTLDSIATAFKPSDVLTIALPKIQECFVADDMIRRESGMLALGALSTGCLDAMAIYLPQLFPFWLSNLQSELPEMRCISCWVISRYCLLFSDFDNPEKGVFLTMEQAKYFYIQSLHALIQLMYDGNCRVQVATCSAICILIENSFEIASLAPPGHERNILLDHVTLLLNSVNHAFHHYGVKSSLLLVDMIGTLADTIREELEENGSAWTALYLPQLMKKLTEVDDNDMRLFPLLECCTSVFGVIGKGEGKEYVVKLYERCLKIMTAHVQRYDSVFDSVLIQFLNFFSF